MIVSPFKGIMTCDECADNLMSTPAIEVKFKDYGRTLHLCQNCAKILVKSIKCYIANYQLKEIFKVKF